MPRAYSQTPFSEPDHDAGQWQALRGELVALLDKVENHYGQPETAAEEPAMSGLARRVRTLRDQMNGTESASRRQEALRTVKRAVDRFSDRDGHDFAEDDDGLSEAIAEIRSRQGAMVQPARRVDMPEIRELGVLVGGMSERLELLEGELKSQRSNTGHVREVAGQVEQLTQVVELLAGAIGETGQVKRLEGQIAALAGMIESSPKVDLNAINARLDDVSGTVGKLAELQAAQMEREITRENERGAHPQPNLAPAMQSIEESVRNVYDRIDAIERNVALSSGDFEKLTGELAAFTRAMKDRSSAPDALVLRVEALADKLDVMDTGHGDVAALKSEIGSLRDAVLQRMEPRFNKLETQIEALSGKIDSGAVENQLKALMARMDDAGSQLDGLARLYASGEDRPDFEALATMVAERTGEAMSRKAPAPVAMFGPESLKSIEDRLAGLIKSAGKAPDYDSMAELIAARTSETLAKTATPPAASEDIEAMEQRMSALLNTAGKETAERLTRLEKMLSSRNEVDAAKAAIRAEPSRLVEAPRPKPAADAFADAIAPRKDSNDKLDSILAGLSLEKSDAMPANPADEAPLIDPGFKPEEPVAQRKVVLPPPRLEPKAPVAAHAFDPSQAEKPPRPQSSLAEDEQDPFAPPAPAIETPVAASLPSNTSTFVAAARRAQRLRQEQVDTTTTSNSMLSRAMARVRAPKKAEKADKAEPAAIEALELRPAEPILAPVLEKPADIKPAAMSETVAPVPEAAAEEGEKVSFLTRHRRPLLLAATLVAVSMLALNLVLQRMNAPASQPTIEASSTVAPASNPPVSDDQSVTVPPRVIDLIDPVSTASINPGEPMTFARASAPPMSTPMPPSLVAGSGRIELAAVDPGVVPEVTGSIAANPPVPETFELPPEAVGPIELRDAAAKGNAQAQFEVGAILGEGQQADADLAEAAKWYERAAAQGFAPAQYRLGNLYEVGSGVEKDLEQARLWYQRGAEAGNRMAMHNLAALYAGGQLGDQQFELAAEWFEQAAGFGMTDSQFNLGMLYARGLGLDQSFEQSFKWFSLAARNGDKDAAQARDDIAKSLSAEAVTRITQELKAWKPASVNLAANYAPIGTWSSAFDPGETITTRDVILKVQQSLARLGFDIGTPDGVAGPKTAEAIKSFERATGMNEVGRINPRLLAVLGSQPV